MTLMKPILVEWRNAIQITIGHEMNEQEVRTSHFSEKSRSQILTDGLFVWTYDKLI